MTWGRGSTRASRALRARVLRAWPECYLRYPGCTVVSTQDDHIVPLSAGGTNDFGNHAGACAHCHAIKSERERRAGLERRRPRGHDEPHPGALK